MINYVKGLPKERWMKQHCWMAAPAAEPVSGLRFPLLKPVIATVMIFNFRVPG